MQWRYQAPNGFNNAPLQPSATLTLRVDMLLLRHGSTACGRRLRRPLGRWCI